MAAENAGSIYSEVRIRLDKLRSDIVEATTFLDRFEKGTTDSAAATSKKATASFNAMSIAAVAASAAIIGAFRGMITASANYSQAMSDVQAATRGTAADLAALEGAASAAGDELATSTTDALGAVEALAKAGVSTADIMGGALPGALTLAAAGSMNVAGAAEIAAATMTQFGLAGSDVAHIADLLAAGAGKAQGEVSDLSQALKQAGLVASQTGLSVDDTVGSLAAFASAGLLGSDAGTSFRTMLLRLTPQSKEAADAMKKLGINAFDSKGEFIGITKFAGQLQEQLKGLTTEQRNSALATIFGSDSIRAANVLYTQGAEGIQSWIEKVNDTGFAAETARIKLDNLAGDMKKLDAATTDAGAAIGQSLSLPLRTAAQFGAQFFEFISKIPAPILALIGTVGALGGGLLAITAAGSALIPILVGIGTAATAALGPIGLAVTAITLLGAAAAATIQAMDQEAIKSGLDTFGEIGKNAGLAGKDLEDFARNTARAEASIAALNATQVKMFNEARFKALAENIGLTHDQLAQVLLTSTKIPPAIKKVAEGFQDADRVAADSIKRQQALGDDYVNRYKKVPAVVAGVKVAVNSLSDAIAYQNLLERLGVITTEEALKNKIKIREDEIASIIKAGEAVGKLSAADQERIRILKGFNEENKASLEALGQTEATAAETQLGFLDDLDRASQEYYDQKDQDAQDAYDTQLAFDQALDALDEEAKNKAIARRKEIAQVTFDVFSALTNALASIFASLNQQQVADLDASFQRQKELIENNGLTRKEALEKNLEDAKATGDAQEIAEADKQLRLFNLEQQFTREKAQLQYQAAHAQWLAQVALTAGAVAKGIAEAIPNPFAISLASVIGGLQIAAVAAAQPQPPKFATGGIVLPQGNAGTQVTVADQGGGELMFGTGALGAPLMQGFARLVADMVLSSGGAKDIAVVVNINGKTMAQAVAREFNNGTVKVEL